MNPQRFVLFLLMVFCFATGHGYELATHGRITEQAFLKSNLVLDPQLLPNLGLIPNSINPFGTAYYDVSGSVVSERVANIFERDRDRMRDPNEANTIKGWLMRGAIREDDVPAWIPGSSNPQDDPYSAYTLVRVLNHFYDPALNRPLTVAGIGWGSKAPDWATGSNNVFTNPNTPDASRRNHFTVFDAREAMYRALTGRDSQGNRIALTVAERNKYWATTFRALGDTVHLLQDMGQPQHTRNDPHAGGKYNGSAGPEGHKSVFENYIDARATGTKFKTVGATPIEVTPLALTYTGYPVPAFTNYLSFFTTRNKDAGIYDRKGLADYSNRGFFTAGKNMGNTDYAYPLNTPSTYLLEKVYTDWQGNPLPNGSYITLLKDIVPDTVNPALGGGAKPLTSYGLFDQFLTPTKPPAYTLNRYNYDAMADLLIPRSVAYSAGLINYFFRGKMNVEKDPAYNGKFIIRNLGQEAMAGAFELYYDGVDDKRYLLSTSSLSAAAGGATSGIALPPIPDTLPDAKITGNYMLVFHGDMGEELASGQAIGAVIGKVVTDPYSVRLEKLLFDAEPPNQFNPAATYGLFGKLTPDPVLGMLVAQTTQTFRLVAKDLAGIEKTYPCTVYSGVLVYCYNNNTWPYEVFYYDPTGGWFSGKPQFEWNWSLNSSGKLTLFLGDAVFFSFTYAAATQQTYSPVSFSKSFRWDSSSTTQLTSGWITW